MYHKNSADMERHLIYIKDLNESIIIDLEESASFDGSSTYTSHPTSIGTPMSDHKYDNFPTANISGTIENLVFRSPVGYKPYEKIRKITNILEEARVNAYKVEVITRHKVMDNMNIKSIKIDIPNDSISTIKISIDFVKIIEADVRTQTVKVFIPQNSGSVEEDAKKADKKVFDNVVKEFIGKGARSPYTIPYTKQREGKIVTFNPALNKYVDLVSKNTNELNEVLPEDNMYKYYNSNNWG